MLHLIDMSDRERDGFGAKLLSDSDDFFFALFCLVPSL